MQAIIANRRAVCNGRIYKLKHTFILSQVLHPDIKTALCYHIKEIMQFCMQIRKLYEANLRFTQKNIPG